MSGSRLAGWRIFAPCGRLILSRLAGLLHAVVSGFQSAARERAPVGLHFSSLWVMFALVLLANPESVWGGTTQGYECREVGTNRGYHCTIYQGVEFVHICYLVSVPTFCLSLRLATRGDRIEKSWSGCQSYRVFKERVYRPLVSLKYLIIWPPFLLFF